MKVLNELVVKSIKENKTRTLTTIIGTTLAFTLMFLIALGIASIRNSMIKNITTYIGSYHYVISNVDKIKSDLITNNDDIKSYYILNNEIINNDNNNQNYMLSSYNLDYDKDIILYEGRFPKDGEVIISRSTQIFDDIDIGDFINSYKVVGVYEKCNLTHYDYEDSYYIADNQLITNYRETDIGSYYITYKKIEGSHSKVNALARQLGFKRMLGTGGIIRYENISYNDELLELYGEYAKSGAGAMLKLMLIVILSVISLAAFFILVNAFGMSVKERIKQFGILSSVGTTRKQIVLMVLLEGLYIGIISMVIAFLLSFLLLMQVLGIVNYFLKNTGSLKFFISIYTPYLLISIAFGIVTLFLAVLSPARSVSKASPIESISENKTYSSGKRKFKKDSSLAKLFKIEGILASKNTRRNSSKYRIIIITISISILLFLFTSNLINIYTDGINRASMQSNYDFSISGVKESQVSLFKEIKKADSIEVVKTSFISFEKPDSDLYLTKKDGFVNRQTENMIIYQVSDETFDYYIKKYNLDSNYPIIVNTYFIYDMQGNFVSTQKIFKEDVKFKLNFCNYESNFDNEKKTYINTITDCYLTYNSVNLINDNKVLIGETVSNGFIISNKKMFNKILEDCNNFTCQSFKENPTSTIYINSKKNIYEVGRELKDIINQIGDKDIFYYAPAVDYLNAKMATLAMKFLVGVVLTLIILICMTFMINTIASSLMLRKTEFAVLKSIGMTNKSIKKMVFLESINVGIKALIIGIVLAYFSIYVFFNAINTNTNIPKKYSYPLKETIIMCIVISICNVIIYLYMINRINKNNIIDDIRNTNI